jgi:hypothetical protein
MLQYNILTYSTLMETIIKISYFLNIDKFMIPYRMHYLREFQNNSCNSYHIFYNDAVNNMSICIYELNTLNIVVQQQ